MSGTNTKKKDELYAPEMPGQIDNTAVQGANQKYTAAKDALDAMNYDSFKQGSMYDGLKKSYEHQGQQAMKNTLGQVAARTGGMASSYATTAAQQSYNNYMHQLEDVARSMYNDEYSRARDKVTLAQGEYDRAYGEYRDRVGDAWTKYGAEQEQYNQDRTYNYNVDKDNKLARDAELKALLGSEDFDWDNHDWNGDAPGLGTPADFFSGSTYGEDYWKAYANNAAEGHKFDAAAEMASEFQEYIGSGMSFEEIIQHIGGMYDRDTGEVTLEDGSSISVKDLTGHTAEYWHAQIDKHEKQSYQYPDTSAGRSEIMSKLIDSNNCSLNSKNQSNFNFIFGDGAYDAVQKFKKELGQLAPGSESAEDRFFEMVERIKGIYPNLSEEMLDRIVEKYYPGLWFGFTTDPDEFAKNYLKK